MNKIDIPSYNKSSFIIRKLMKNLKRFNFIDFLLVLNNFLKNLYKKIILE